MFLKISLASIYTILLFGCNSSGNNKDNASQTAATFDTSVVEPGRLLPKKLRYLPFGMIIEHYPNPVYPEKEDNQYVWKHNTTVRANKDMRIIEYGSFVYTKKGWYLRVSNDAKYFDEHYGTKNGELKKDSVYTDPLSFRLGDTVYAGDAMWYYIAVDKEGNKYKGIGPIETEEITLQQLNKRKGLSLFSTSKSKFNWTGYGEIGTYALSGSIILKDGTYRVNNDTLLSATLVMDMQSLNSDNKDLVGHLKGPDFFETGRYPEATFELQKPTLLADKMNVQGNLTVKNIVQPAIIQLNHIIKNGSHYFNGKLTLDRTKFNIKYNSKSFFSNLGDQAIKNSIDLSFDIVSEN